MYLQVPSGLMSIIYDGFAKDVHNNSHWKRLGNNDWMLLYRFNDHTYTLHTKIERDVKKCVLKISKDAWKVEFDVMEMERQCKLTDKNQIAYIEMLTITAKELSKGEVGTFFLLAYELEEKIFELNKVRKHE